jgi:signal transduction histidine kinase
VIHAYEKIQDGLKEDGGKRDAYLNIIHQNTLRAKKLIEDMNSLAEIDNPGFELHRREEDIIGFFNGKLEEIRMLAADKRITVEGDMTDGRTNNSPVLIDSHRLSQVIDNIAGNSISFTPEQGKIIFKARIEDHTIHFTVSDSGPGFSEKDLNHLFKKFYKGDDSRSREKGHSGLGLYIARSIIERTGGTIEAYNMPDGGACLNFNNQY